MSNASTDVTQSIDIQGGSERVGWLFGGVAALIWGGFLAVSRQGIGAGLYASDLAFLRYLLAGPLLLPWLCRRDIRTLAGVGWRRGIVLAVLAGPLFVMVGAEGYVFAPLAHGAVIQLGTLALAATILAVLTLGERITAARACGMTTIVIGLALTAGPELWRGTQTAWMGDLMFAVAGGMWAMFTILLRRWRISPLVATAIVAVLSSAAFIPLYLASHGLGIVHRASVALLVEQMLMQGLLSGIVALFAFGRAIQYLGAGRAALFPVIAPAVAILIGIPLTGEWPTAFQLAGLVTLSIGLIVSAAGGSIARIRLFRRAANSFQQSGVSS
ncbi:MAG: DMT family transporter [Rhodospirillales bacterium]|nr:DMT family transporter [Rhodospirillales bacterium]